MREAALNSNSQLVMPDLSRSSYGFHHTVDSALEVLYMLGVPAPRVTLRMAGHGMPSRFVVEQSPAPGTPLSGDTQISLAVSGLGFYHNLPIAMWDSGGDQEPRTKEVFDLLDDPLQKASHWIRDSSHLLGISPENTAACALWISLFGLDPADWHGAGLYPLALLLPSMQELAGTERGIRLVLDILLGLPLREIRYRRNFHAMEQGEVTHLGRESSRLGIDCVLGKSFEDTSKSELVVGPVGLRTYYEFCQTGMRELLNRTLRLVLPCYGQYSVFWVVDGEDSAPRLVTDNLGQRLGINSYLRRKVSPAGAD
jgi:Type VI secretion, TssG